MLYFIFQFCDNSILVTEFYARVHLNEVTMLLFRKGVAQLWRYSSSKLIKNFF